MRDPRRRGQGRAADRERSDSHSVARSPRLPMHEEHWQPNGMQTQHHSGSASSQSLVIYPSDPIFHIVAAIAQFQQDQQEKSINLKRAKDAEISALQDECRTLAELVRKRDLENAWLHKRARQIQEESDELLAGKVAEERQSYSMSMLAKTSKLKR